jgi:hypothetical protein
VPACGAGVAAGAELATGAALARDAAGTDGDAAGVSLGDGDGEREGEGEGKGDGRAVAFDDARGAGDATGASVAGATVAAKVGAALATGTSLCCACRPATDSPAPMTKPSTITPSTIGMNGSDGPSSRGGGRRLRGGGVSCIDGAIREMDERCFPRNDAA